MTFDPMQLQLPRLIVGNALSHLAYAPPELVEALRYDLAYQDPSALPQAGWDGWYRLMDREGRFPTGLLPQVRRLLVKYRVGFHAHDAREKPDDHLPLHYLRDLRPYQAQLAHRALEMGRGVIDAPPRSGKTRIGIAIWDLNPQPTLWIAPTRGIVKQTVRAMEQLLTGTKIQMLIGGGSIFRKHLDRRKAYDADIVVTTAATAVKLDIAFYKTRKMLIIDEFHHAGAAPRGDKPSMYSEINALAESCYYRFGLTGTHFRSDENTELLMHAVLSDVIGKIQVTDLVREGHLVPLDMIFVPIDEPRVYGHSLDEAYRFGVEHHEVRNHWIVWAARHLVAAGRRTIVLVKLIAHGEKLAAMMPEATFVNGQDSDAVDEGIRRFNEGKIPILIGTSVLGEGIDLPAADGLVYAKGGKASVTVTQDIYRVLTASHGKTRGVAVDFADRHHPILMRHAIARGRLYAVEETFRVDVLGQARVLEFPQLVAR